jgi:hypothetical protein
MKRMAPAVLAALFAVVFLSGCAAPSQQACAEEWKCTGWSDCEEGQQTRSCTDVKECGTETAKPAEIQACDGSCEGVTCPDKCEGTTLMRNGSCDNGLCMYTQVKKSPQCGYSEAGVSFETLLRYCDYLSSQNKYDMFFTITVTGETNPDPRGTIWVIADNPDYGTPYYTIQKQYVKGDVLWQSTMWSGIPYKGKIWGVRDVPEFEDIDFSLIYCVLESAGEKCSESNGIVLYSGNTFRDCKEGA